MNQTTRAHSRRLIPWVSKFSEAIDLLGGQSEAGRQIGASQQRIYFILNKSRKFPDDLVIPVENATGGRITRIDLRPDLFGDGFKNAHGLNSGTIPVAGLAEKNGGVPSAVQKGV